MAETIITITAGEISLDAEINSSETAVAILKALPLEGTVNTWGDEIYFSIPVVQAPAPDARAEVAVGDLAYWPAGKAFCIFFGPTPVSENDTPRAYSPVNVFGRVIGTAASLRQIAGGTPIHVTRKNG
jgi:hypothetical protein